MMQKIITIVVSAGIIYSCQNNSAPEKNELNSNDTITVIEKHDTTQLDLNADLPQSELAVYDLEDCYLRFAFNDSLRNNYEETVNFLDENEIIYEEYTEYDMSENVILFKLKDANKNYAEFRLQYSDDEYGYFTRYSHTFNFDNQTQTDEFRKFVFEDLKIRFGSELEENNETNCSNYKWKYANLLYNCSASKNAITVQS